MSDPVGDNQIKASQNSFSTPNPQPVEQKAEGPCNSDDTELVPATPNHCDPLTNVKASNTEQADVDVDQLSGISQRWHDASEIGLNDVIAFESQYSIALENSAVVEREQWGGQCEFLMSSIASAVGLGNIWRFPLIAGQNGGGAFLIPYLVVLIVIGRPLYMLENGLGQFCSGGQIKIWEMSPIFRGVGIAATVASFVLSTFYCVIMGWAILYFFYSMWPELPWDKNETLTLSGISGNPTKSSKRFFDQFHLGIPDVPHDQTDFWNGRGLDGPPGLNLAISLFVGWLLVWILMVRGIAVSGKAAYFNGLFPYFVLAILFVSGLSLEGSGDGIAFFFTPTWAKIFDPQTWFHAIGQCFFSLGVSFGNCMMFSSFNNFHHKLGRDVAIISIMDTCTSILAGTCLFAMIGNIAKTSNDPSVTIESLTQAMGPGLAFVTFPNVLKAFGQYPGPNCISALFFFMLTILALGSLNGLVGVPVTAICDYCPKWKKWIVVTGMCCLSFLIGLLYICPTGSYLIDLVDTHGLVMVIYMVAIFEVLGIVVAYGLKNIINDFEFMLGVRTSMYWVVCWAILPLLMIGIFISYVLSYSKDEKWPDVVVGCAWGLTTTGWLIIPTTAVVVIQTRKSRFLIKRIKASYLPTRRWGPADLTNRKNWRRWKKSKPTEFGITGRILVALRLRNFVTPGDPSEYWSTDVESIYQHNSKPSSGTTVVVHAENPSDQTKPQSIRSPSHASQQQNQPEE